MRDTIGRITSTKGRKREIEESKKKNKNNHSLGSSYYEVHERGRRTTNRTFILELMKRRGQTTRRMEGKGEIEERNSKKETKQEKSKNWNGSLPLSL